MKIDRPLPENGEADCPSCLSEKSVARHNATWSCHKCGYFELIDEDKEKEREMCEPCGTKRGETCHGHCVAPDSVVPLISKCNCDWDEGHEEHCNIVAANRKLMSHAQPIKDEPIPKFCDTCPNKALCETERICLKGYHDVSTCYAFEVGDLVTCNNLRCDVMFIITSRGDNAIYGVNYTLKDSLGMRYKNVAQNLLTKTGANEVIKCEFIFHSNPDTNEFVITNDKDVISGELLNDIHLALNYDEELRRELMLAIEREKIRKSNSHEYKTTNHIESISRADDKDKEILRLTECLSRSKENNEKFERLFYIAAGFLDEIANQRIENEMDQDEKETADYESGFTELVKLARKATTRDDNLNADIEIYNYHWVAKFTNTINLAYIVIFLRNGGERLRAIRLARSVLLIDIHQAVEWVDAVKLVRGPIIDNMPENEEAPLVVSHWPKSIEHIIKFYGEIESNFKPKTY